MQKNITQDVRNLLKNNKFYVKNNRLKKFVYEENYHSKVKDPDGKKRNLLLERNYKLSQMPFIIKYLKRAKHGKILDVGCGHGWLLSSLNKKWKKYGLDVSEFASRNAKKYAKIYTGDLNDIKEKNFDFITALHVIEHHIKPEKFIVKLRKILKKNGTLILETPDFDSAAARRYGNKFRLLHDQSHISLFSQDSLIRFVRYYGFKVIDIDYPFFETPFFKKKNILKILKKNSVSPPFYGSTITLFLKKK